MNPADPARPDRVRVSADTPAAPSSRVATGPVRLQGDSDMERVYTRGLVRAQLLLALGCLVGFLVCAGVLVLVLLAVPALEQVVLWSVPLPWLLHAYGFYPIIVVFALIYVRAAARNERRFSMLREAGS